MRGAGDERQERQGEQLDLPIAEERPPAAAAPREGAIPVVNVKPSPSGVTPIGSASLPWRMETDAPTCHECGTIMVRSGACHKCLNCGATSGCS